MKHFGRFTALVLMLALMAALMPASALAGGPAAFAMVSGTKSLNLRAGPGTGYAWLGSVARGGWVQVVENYGDWYLVNLLDGNRSGYMSAKFLKNASASGQSGEGSVFTVNNPVPTQFLNLRQYPSMTAPVLGIFYNGAQGTVLSSQDGWFHVEIDGMYGYFRGEYLRFHNGGWQQGTSARVHSPNGGAVNVRSGPGYGYGVLTQCSPGTVVTAYLKGTGFWFVAANGQTGFMDSKFLSDGAAPQYPQPNPQPNVPGMTSGIVTNTGKKLNLREQPSLTARVLGQYPGGTRLNIEQQGADWCRVTVAYDGARGYMMSRFLTLYGLPGASVKRVVHPKGTFVYLRSQPTQAVGTVITRVPHGSTVNVVSPDGAWTKVRYGTYVGYMASAFLR